MQAMQECPRYNRCPSCHSLFCSGKHRPPVQQRNIERLLNLQRSLSSTDTRDVFPRKNSMTGVPSGLNTVAVKERRVRSNCRPIAVPMEPMSSAMSATTLPSWSSTVYRLACSKPRITVPLQEQKSPYLPLCRWQRLGTGSMMLMWRQVKLAMVNRKLSSKYIHNSFGGISIMKACRTSDILSCRQAHNMCAPFNVSCDDECWMVHCCCYLHGRRPTCHRCAEMRTVIEP